MKLWKIINLYTGACLGTVEAKTERGAIRKAGRYTHDTIAVEV